MSFANDREGWYIPSFVPGTACQQQGYELWRTSDAGHSWELLSYATGRTEYLVIGPLFGQCKTGVLFADAMRGLVVTSDPYTQPTVHRTGDGGVTWKATRLPDPPGFTTNGGGNALQPQGLRWIGPTVLIDTVDTMSNHHVFRSDDRGASWRAVAVKEGGATLAFVTASRWLQLGPANASRETTNGGATWHPYDTDFSPGATPVAPEAVFADAAVGYLTVRGAIRRTEDGGAHWSAIRTPGTQSP